MQLRIKYGAQNINETKIIRAAKKREYSLL